MVTFAFIKATNSHQFEIFCASIILFNMLLVILETDQSADDGEPDTWIKAATYSLLGFYTLELSTKLYILRVPFFYDTWNVLDFCIVSVDLILLIVGFIVANMPSVAVLRVFRLVRLARAFKAAKQFRELNALIRSFGFAMKAIFWGILMIVMILTIWVILAVQLIHPINVRISENSSVYRDCDRCPRAFSTVFESCLTFWQQVVAGDSWGEVSLPIITEAPWTCMFFMGVLVTVNLTMLNLILAVIVEAGARANEEDMHDKAVQEQKKVRQAEARLIELCQLLDVDSSGSLNIEEFLNGFENNKEFSDCLQLMSVTKSDINMIFNICDEDGSGDVNYVEFVDQLRRIRRQGEQMLLYYVTEIRHKVQQLKLRLIDNVHRALEELPDACRAQDPNLNEKLQREDSEIKEVKDTNEILACPDTNGRDVTSVVATSELSSVLAQTIAANRSDSRAQPDTDSGLLPREPSRAMTDPFGLRPSSPSPLEPKAPAPPTFSRNFFDEIDGAVVSRKGMANASMPSRLLGDASRRRDLIFAGGQLEALLQISQDIVAIVQDAAASSNCPVGIVNTVAAIAPELGLQRNLEGASSIPLLPSGS
jgi:hypothetical protein